MDSNQIEKDGYSGIQAYLTLIESITNKKELLVTCAELQKINISPFFGFNIDADSKSSHENITYLYQSGLGLPDRDYYLREDEKGDQIKQEYKAHITKLFELIGTKQNIASTKAQNIYELEHELATACLSRAESRVVENKYNKYNMKELQDFVPSVNWMNFFQAIGSHSITELIVEQPKFMKKVDSILSTCKIEDAKDYLTWYLLNNTADHLSNDFQKQNFHFRGTVLRGTKSMKPRWKRVLNKINENLGEPLGQLYVAENFSPDSKKRVSEMVENIKAVFRDRLNNVDWMSKETKRKAIEKLNTFDKKIGYPDVWRDYSKLFLTKDAYFQNILSCRKFEFEHVIAKLGKPVNKEEWHMSPQTVNAYYSPTGNEIVFPSAILQPPFFNPDADDAVNYGAIGAIIGHEFSHGFDDQGSKFDGNGNMNNWWTDEDRNQFDTRTQLIIDQFSEFEALDSLYVDGKLTLGENIADLGGITLAYYALQKANKKNPTSAINGYDYKQRFFLGYAQVWRGHMTDDELMRRIKTDPHSPPHYRVIAPLSNLQEFQQAFGCSNDANMVRNDSIKPFIW